MTFIKVANLIERDMITSKHHAHGGTKDGYFSRKARLLEGRFARHMQGSFGANGETQAVGYEPGRKFIYPGLPVEFAISIDRAVLEVIELMALSGHVAMTGSCCAGHPSALIGNPYLEDAMEDPRFAAETRLKHSFEGGMYTENLSPYFRIMLIKDSAGITIAERLAAIRIKAKGAGGTSLKINAQILDGNGVSHDGAITLGIMGVPTYHGDGSIPGHRDVVSIYQQALACFWSEVKGAFERFGGEKAPALEPAGFVPDPNVDWGRQYNLIKEREGNGRKHPNYMYFNGSDKLMEPVMAETPV